LFIRFGPVVFISFESDQGRSQPRHLPQSLFYYFYFLFFRFRCFFLKEESKMLLNIEEDSPAGDI